MSEPRDFDSPEYKQWRKRVYGRDHYKCRMPGCPGLSQHFEAHHIRRWADYPALRFIVSNGITLCKVCHERVKDRERDFEAQFSAIVRQSGSMPRGELSNLTVLAFKARNEARNADDKQR